MALDHRPTLFFRPAHHAGPAHVPPAVRPTADERSHLERPSPPPGAARRAVTGSFIGNFVEWFDYAVYGYFATTIATVFFPSSNPRTALIETYGLFALSFLFRPIGGIFWGHIGDRIGRRTALATSILLMSGATFCIALLPSYHSIGILAPLLLLACRIVQGFSAAGEYAGASAYLTEYAPQGRRGLMAAVVPASTAAGLLVGSLIAGAMSAWMPGSALDTWGWRVPFALAAPLGIVGLIIRRRLEDSPEFVEAAAEDKVAGERAPIALVFRQRRALLVTFAAALLNAVGFYLVLSYLPTYLSEELDLSSSKSFLSATIALTFYIGLVLAAGRLSDTYGRKRLMQAASVLFLVGSIPAFFALGGGSFALIVLVQILMGGVLALNDGVLPSFLSEQFPTKVRYTGFALTFNLANAIFGGTAPMISTWLIGVTHWKLAPAAYMVLIAAITLLAVSAARETSGSLLHRD